jgi:hypothetical protein
MVENLFSFQARNQKEYTEVLRDANKIFEKSYNFLGGSLSKFRSYAAPIDSPHGNGYKKNAVELLPDSLLDIARTDSPYGKIMQAYLLEYVPRHEGFELALIEATIPYPDCHFTASVFAREDMVGCSKDFLDDVRLSNPFKRNYVLTVPTRETKVYQVILDISETFETSFSESCALVYGGHFSKNSNIVEEIEINAHVPHWNWENAKKVIEEWQQKVK